MSSRSSYRVRQQASLLMQPTVLSSVNAESGLAVISGFKARNCIPAFFSYGQDIFKSKASVSIIIGNSIQHIRRYTCTAKETSSLTKALACYPPFFSLKIRCIFGIKYRDKAYLRAVQKFTQAVTGKTLQYCESPDHNK